MCEALLQAHTYSLQDSSFIKGDEGQPFVPGTPERSSEEYDDVEGDEDDYDDEEEEEKEYAEEADAIPPLREGRI